LSRKLAAAPPLSRALLRGSVVLALGLLLGGCASAGSAPGGVPGASSREAERDSRSLPAGVRIFDGEGNAASWEELLEAARGARIVLLGEVHDDERGHQARHALTRALALPGVPRAGEACSPHVLSLEMLESDVQLIVDEYQKGLITRDHFQRGARPWDNHDRDYEPYLELARECGFPIVAANPPRRYVNRVARVGAEGLDELSEAARAFLPPLPIAPPSSRYRAQWDALMGRIRPHDASGSSDSPEEERPEPPVPPMLAAQNLWDAGMAWAIAQAAEAHPRARVVHVAGSFHVQGWTGIPDHLKRYLPDFDPLIILAFPVSPGSDFDPEEHRGLADFILLTDR